jgi:hypothetical protein
MAGDSYTMADTKGETDWGSTRSSNYESRALDRWIYNSISNGWYEPYHPSSADDVAGKVWADIYLGHMVAADMAEVLGAWWSHYNHHPDAKIRHWTSTYGYADSGATFAGQDPGANAGLGGWQNVQKTFTITSTLAWKLMSVEYNQYADRGVVW